MKLKLWPSTPAALNCYFMLNSISSKDLGFVQLGSITFILLYWCITTPLSLSVIPSLILPISLFVFLCPHMILNSEKRKGIVLQALNSVIGSSSSCRHNRQCSIISPWNTKEELERRVPDYHFDFFSLVSEAPLDNSLQGCPNQNIIRS